MREATPAGIGAAAPRGSDDARLVRLLIERWADDVRERDMEGILACHVGDIGMFDVPPPLRAEGMAAYEDTWRLFLSPNAPSARGPTRATPPVPVGGMRGKEGR